MVIYSYSTCVALCGRHGTLTPVGLLDWRQGSLDNTGNLLLTKITIWNILDKPLQFSMPGGTKETSCEKGAQIAVDFHCSIFH